MGVATSRSERATYLSMPLEGIRILDLSRLLPGPFATMILADLGADVIRVESTDGGDRMRYVPPRVAGLSAHFMAINRNKRSVAVNLKDPRGRQILFKLVRTADVMVEGFKPGTVDRLGVSYDTIRGIKPDIIYCSISGYGQTGPYRDRAGHDINYMGLGAALDLMTDPGVKPRIPGLFLGDLTAALYAVSGITSAVVQRQRTGQGQYIDVGMLDGLMGLQTYLSARHLIAGLPAEHGTTGMTDAGPAYQVFECRDGKYVTFAPLEPRFWENFCKAIERPDLLERHWDPSIVPDIEAMFAQRTQAEWVALSERHDFCCEPVLSLGQALEHPQVTARGMIVETDDPTVGRIRQVASAIRFGEVRGEVRRAAPLAGEHTVDILREAGVSGEEIDRLVAGGVLAVTERLSK